MLLLPYGEYAFPGMVSRWSFQAVCDYPSPKNRKILKLKIFLLHKHFPPPNGILIKNDGAFLQTWDDDPSSPVISWGLGFRFGDSEKLNEIAGELQARKVGRGNIAQLRNQENTMIKALESEPWILLRSGNHWESSYSYLSFCGGPLKKQWCPICRNHD